MFGPIDWADVFIPQTPLLEIFVRGAVTYLVLYALLRYVRRQVGSLSVNDLLVLVLIADAAQNAMAGEYTSVGDGVLLVAVIIGIASSLNWLGYHVPGFQRLIHPDAVPLVKDGMPDDATLRRYMVTREELMTQLRLQGVAEISEVQAAYVEGNGQISVLTEDHESRGTGAQSIADAT